MKGLPILRGRKNKKKNGLMVQAETGALLSQSAREGTTGAM